MGRGDVYVAVFRPPLFAWVAVGVLSLSLGACAGRAPSPPVEPGPSLTPQEVLATLHAREANLASVKGLFQADVKGALSPLAFRLQGTLLYQRPQSIRITGFTQFGSTLFDFLLNGQSYSLHRPTIWTLSSEQCRISGDSVISGSRFS